MTLFATLTQRTQILLVISGTKFQDIMLMRYGDEVRRSVYFNMTMFALLCFAFQYREMIMGMDVATLIQ